METKRKRLSRKEKKERAIVDLIDQMFLIAGHDVTYEDIKDRKDDWFAQWTMTVEQGEEFKEWGKRYLMKELQMRAKQAETEMQWINLQWGLKYSNWEDYHKIKTKER